MGQEVINRMDTMGRLNKRLVQIALQEPLSSPTQAMADDAPIGTLTSFTRVGPPIAMGILRPVVWEEGATLQVDSKGASSLGPVRLS
jgi:folate-binding Fe-S cluster repair protein YgfZ